MIVGRVVKGGVAERSHLLREGDELIEANGHDLRGRSVTEVCDILVSFTNIQNFEEDFASLVSVKFGFFFWILIGSRLSSGVSFFVRLCAQRLISILIP